MCGIAGYIFVDDRKILDTSVINRMLRVQKHRGPDDSGVRVFSLKDGISQEFDPKVTSHIRSSFEGVLGFNRLSIQDLSQNGHQPMVSPDGQVFITLNGEIYNAFDYKSSLAADGFTFKGRSDTEVVLNLYLKYGFRGLIDRLNGMFAIVVVDLRLNRIFIVRDRFGIKPIYYLHSKGIFAFASELKSFYVLDSFRPTVNVSMLDEYLLFRNNINDTLIDGVQGLEPGCFLTFCYETGLTKKTYFQINDYQRTAHDDSHLNENIDSLKTVLSSSVKSQLISDVKLGCQLSGGVDSSVVTWLSKEAVEKDSLESISIVFNNKHFSEEPFIDYVSKKLNIVSHKYKLLADYYRQNMEAATWHFEAPLNHPNTIAIYLLAQQAKEHVTVLLSGEGADEVFGGYGRFYELLNPYANRKFFSMLTKSLPNPGQFLKQYLNRTDRAITASAFMTSETARLLKPDFNAGLGLAKRRALYDRMTGDIFDRQVKYEMSAYLPDLLIRQDKMSMAHSIENRVPFLDNDLVAHSFTIPVNQLQSTYRGNSRVEKYILKKLCATAFGDDFSFRDKMGFGIPLREFMTQPDFNQYLRQAILPGIKRRQMLLPDQIERWVNGINGITVQELEALWVVVSLEVWMRKFIDSNPAEDF